MLHVTALLPSVKGDVATKTLPSVCQLPVGDGASDRVVLGDEEEAGLLQGLIAPDGPVTVPVVFGGERIRQEGPEVHERFQGLVDDDVVAGGAGDAELGALYRHDRVANDSLDSLQQLPLPFFGQFIDLVEHFAELIAADRKSVDQDPVVLSQLVLEGVDGVARDLPGAAVLREEHGGRIRLDRETVEAALEVELSVLLDVLLLGGEPRQHHHQGALARLFNIVFVARALEVSLHQTIIGRRHHLDLSQLLRLADLVKLDALGEVDAGRSEF